jgi:hypothetical protein
MMEKVPLSLRPVALARDDEDPAVRAEADPQRYLDGVVQDAGLAVWSRGLLVPSARPR